MENLSRKRKLLRFIVLFIAISLGSLAVRHAFGVLVIRKILKMKISELQPIARQIVTSQTGSPNPERFAYDSPVFSTTDIRSILMQAAQTLNEPDALISKAEEAGLLSPVDLHGQSLPTEQLMLPKIIKKQLDISLVESGFSEDERKILKGS